MSYIDYEIENKDINFMSLVKEKYGNQITMKNIKGNIILEINNISITPHTQNQFIISKKGDLRFFGERNEIKSTKSKLEKDLGIELKEAA